MVEKLPNELADIGKEDENRYSQRQRDVDVRSGKVWQRRLFMLNILMIALALLGVVLLFVAMKVDSEAVSMAAGSCLLVAVVSALASRWLSRLKHFKEWMG